MCPGALGIPRTLGASGAPRRTAGAHRAIHRQSQLQGVGQRLAILPCAQALDALLSGELAQRGVLHPTTWLSQEAWLARLRARGVLCERSAGPSSPTSVATSGGPLASESGW